MYTSEHADKFIHDTLEIMTIEKIDFTLFFSELTLIAETSLKNKDLIDKHAFESLFHSKERAKDWLDQWFEMVSLNHKKIKTNENRESKDHCKKSFG